MTALAEACADLAAWLPHARQLITQPDTTGHAGHTKPGSKPPWNAQVANVLLDPHAGVRELEQDLLYQVSGRIRVRGGSDRNTVLAIEAIGRLAAAVDEAVADDAARQLNRYVTAIMQLPAVDLEERCRKVAVPCPRCDRCMLRIFERSGRVACLGCFSKGLMMAGTVSDGYIEWQDGTLT